MQGTSEFIVCIKRTEPLEMKMVKRSKRSVALREASVLQRLSHPSILQLHEVFLQDDEAYFEFDYCRFTLAEVVNVHIRVEELHLHLIAHSVSSLCPRSLELD